MDFNFDFNTLSGGKDPFAAKSNFTTDERFYTLTKDENGNGAAIIRFLPDGEKSADGSMGTIKRVYRYNFRNKNNPKVFYNEWSPVTIGKKDPAFEAWQKLWYEGKKEEAKRFSRSERYIANIKVIKDPKNPEREGKIFLLDMSKTFAEKVKNWLMPSKADLELGAQPEPLFNPMKGKNLKYIAKLGANGITEFSSSALESELTSVYDSVEDAVKDIKENTYKLSSWDTDAEYKTYDELVQEFNRVEGTEPLNETTSVQVETTPQEQVTQTSQTQVSQPSQTSNSDAELDDLLAQLSSK